MKYTFYHKSTREVIFKGDSLVGADMYSANMRNANMRNADMRNADMRNADMSGASMRGANMRNADMRGASMRGASMRNADMRGANMRNADMRGANMRGANMYGVNMYGAKLPHFQIVPSEGSFIGWKKTTTGVIRVLIPEYAERTSTLVGRKCRASEVIPLDEGGLSPTHPYGRLHFKKGVSIKADKFDDDIRVECTHGIHFFMTEQEAKEW